MTLVLTFLAGDTLHTTGTKPEYNPNTIGVDYENGTYEFPYGQEWVYPCESEPFNLANLQSRLTTPKAVASQ